MENVLREPDAVKWLDNDRFVVANEGDLDGGSRGFTIFTKDGKVAYESGASLRIRGRQRRPLSGSAQQEGHRAGRRRGRDLRRGQADLRRLRARLGWSASTRTPAREPEFLQLLPSGIGPEGLVAIPSRNLLVTANETDLVEDNLARSHVMIYERAEGPAAYPMITVGADQRRRAARLGRAVRPGCRPGGGRQALCRVGLGL